ncbi:MAG TPA: BMC domain-containing protein [Candidatus Merdenecus merdavium]|nr:BMC domain-containing protein [Candidatus Merdenecus merdavium]
MGKSYGFFEVPSTTAAIDALDIMCKTANVEFVTWEKKLGGRLVTIIIQGSVSDVTQAMERAAVSCIKEPVAQVVIAHPHEEVVRMVKYSQTGILEEITKE